MGQSRSVSELVGKAAKELQMVAIDSFYDTADQSEAFSWMEKLFRFKVSSYRESYPYGILPFSESDLIGTHWIICEKRNGGLNPLAAFKTTDSKRTDQFRLDYPALGIVRQPHLTPHRDAILAEMEKAHSAGRGLGYLGSWVVRPDVKNNRALAILCRKTCVAMFSHWVYSFDVQSAVTFASLRFHVEKTHQYLGMSRLAGREGEVLSDFQAYPFFDEPACVSVFYRKNHSQESQQDAVECTDLWEKRIVIAPDHSPLFEMPAAKAA